MKRAGLCMAVMAGAFLAEASWYWPFGSSDDADRPASIAELMTGVTTAIMTAYQLSADGDVDGAVEKYREAIREIDRVEIENPDRADSKEFVTLKNKRAYVQAAIDSLLLKQARDNSQPVAVTDTTELERRLDQEALAKGRKSGMPDAEGPKKGDPEELEDAEPAEETASAAKDQGASDGDEAARNGNGVARGKARKPVRSAAAKPRTKFVVHRQEGALTRGDKLKLAGADIANGDYASAEAKIRDLLDEKPNDGAALNLRAAMESAKGDFKAAEKTLDQAIVSNPQSHHAFYNMARLKLSVSPDNADIARRYYETGRAMGGPKDADLERLCAK